MEIVGVDICIDIAIHTPGRAAFNMSVTYLHGVAHTYVYVRSSIWRCSVRLCLCRARILLQVLTHARLK